VSKPNDTSDMVESLARRIDPAAWDAWDRDARPCKRDVIVDPSSRMHASIAAAKAVLDDLMEPTLEMLRAAEHLNDEEEGIFVDADTARLVWRAMVGAAVYMSPLAAEHAMRPRNAEDEAWLNGLPVGREEV